MNHSELLASLPALIVAAAAIAAAAETGLGSGLSADAASLLRSAS